MRVRGRIVNKYGKKGDHLYARVGDWIEIEIPRELRVIPKCNACAIRDETAGLCEAIIADGGYGCGLGKPKARAKRA